VRNRICIGPDCDRRGGHFGYCLSHYAQWRRGKDLTPLRPYNSKTKDEVSCSVSGCGRPLRARGLCKAHSDHVKKYGAPREIKSYRPIGRPCGIVGCDEPALAKLRCAKHLQYGYNLSRFGITLEGFVRLLDAQGGVCAICSGTNPNGNALSVDHDHACCPGDRSCGRCIRGLLCSPCNFAVGMMRDEPARLRVAANYLERSQPYLRPAVA